MKKTKVPLKKRLNHSYHIEIFQDGFDHIARNLREQKYGARYFIITDSNTGKIYGKELQRAFSKAKLKFEYLEVPAGEKSKKWNVAGKLLSQLVDLGANRKSCIVAFGGGVVGDLAGFVASVYMRGINYVQIPTTLLAMVDSSIGGKTAIDLPEGKNLVGTFWQPKKVYMSMKVLKTLPEKQVRSGLAEVIKYGCMWDRKFFRLLEKSFKKMLRKQKKELGKDREVVNLSWLQRDKYQKLLTDIIQKSIRIKKNVVKTDEREEKGIRAMLNYGHTIGHAVELLSRFRLNHGESISIGMNYEAILAHRLGYLKEKEVERQARLFKLVGLPLEIPKKINRKEMVEMMKSDKKSSHGKIGCALIRKLGKPIPGFVEKVSEKRMMRLIK